MANSITKPKKAKSKRQPTRLRAKIQKASAAKQRKQQKLAKKNPEWRSKLKKDPGIPNLFPYKERILNQIEQDRARRKEEQHRRRDLARGNGMVESSTSNDAAAGGGNGADGIPDDEFEGFFSEGGDDDVMDEDESDVDESNPMAALIASARRSAKRYEKELRKGDCGAGGDGDNEGMEDDDDKGDENDEQGDEDDEDDEDDDDDDDDDSDAGLVSEVPGGASSRKAYDKVFKQVVEQADVVLYVLDARDPEGTRSRDVERAVMAAASGGKRLMLVLNKADLIPPPVLRGWLVHLRRTFPTLPLRAAGPAPNAQTFEHKDLSMQGSSAALFRALKSFAASRGGLKRAIQVGVIGYPNVGKSSVINALLARLGGGTGNRGQHKACPAGAEAGVTTAIRAVKLDNKLTLLDSPGIVFPSTSDSGGGRPLPKTPAKAHARLVLLNAVPPKQIDDPLPAVSLLLQRLAATSPDLLARATATYDVPPLLTGGDFTTDFLVQVARKRGRLGRGGVPNIHAAAMAVLTDWRDGRIQGWTEAPTLPLVGGVDAHAATSAASGRGSKTADAVAPDQKEIVTQWAKEFKLEGLWADEDGVGDRDSAKDVDMD